MHWHLARQVTGSNLLQTTGIIHVTINNPRYLYGQTDKEITKGQSLGHGRCEDAWYGLGRVTDAQTDDLGVWVLLLVCFTSHANPLGISNHSKASPCLDYEAHSSEKLN